MEQLTVPEAAERLGVTDRALHKALRAGRIVYARKVGRSYLIDVTALEDYRQRTQPDGEKSKGRPRKQASVSA